jgi:hypothetical protein
MAESLKIYFRKISNGWLRVQIQFEEALFSFTASSVPNDSIYELAKGLFIFASTHTIQTIKWNTEPVEYDFVFTHDSEKASFEIVEYADSRRLKGTGTPRFATNGTLKSLVVPFWRALRELENNEQFEQQWKHPFPQKEMDLLTNVVKTLYSNYQNY